MESAPLPGDTYEDDTSIPDSERLYRVIHPDWVEWEAGEPVRITKQGFQDYPEKKLVAVGVPATAMSVGLASIVDGLEDGIQQMLNEFAAGDPSYGIAALSVECIRSNNQGIVRWTEGGAKPWHAMVFTRTGRKKSKGVSKRLAECAELLRPPSPPQEA